MSKEKIQVNKWEHIQACIDQEKYNEIWKVIYQHTSQVIPDFTLTEETIKEVLVKTLEYYENTLINCNKENKELHKTIEEQEKMIHSLIQGSIHVKTLERSDKDE